MKEKNPIRIRIRLKELFIDYLFIMVYLTFLFIANLLFYLVILGGIPKFTIFQSQMIATFETVLPVMFIFSILDYKKPFGTFGKRKAGLKVLYKTPSFTRSLIRNVVKFLPWQIAHIGIIDGVYTDFSSWTSIFFSNFGMLLALIMLAMGLFRKDKRHIGDLLAGTQIVQLEK
ncbi:RDD family protein [Desemzia sp. RIT804]|uniref:RDD family protein n=1 Tax=Desemzia sp. RIT 804 TaxID=2810209 RepID=UPI0019512562|nr:RDD family protein [Desemzia sp. RIT 804]MBM6614565.1 RDD family protein [Desemzia sp. RIT 804]